MKQPNFLEKDQTKQFSNNYFDVVLEYMRPFPSLFLESLFAIQGLSYCQFGPLLETPANISR